MWPSEFDYKRPASLAEALQLLADHDDAKILAGGHSLIPAMKLRLNEPTMLIDISHLEELKGIANGSSLKIGSLATHDEISRSNAVKSACSALATATGLVGDQQVRNFGTIGGSLAHADPAADPPTVVAACGGKIIIQGSAGSRTVNADDFFIDLFTVDLEPGEIITSIEIPDLGNAKTAYVKMPHPASRYAIVGICAVLDMNGDTCQSARIAVGGATVKPTRAPGAEKVLVGTTLGEDILNQAADMLMADINADIMGCMTFVETYRQQMAGVYLKRAVRAAAAS